MTTRIAIIGAGVSGLAAAQQLATLDDVQVVLFEARPRIGGRAFTDTSLVGSKGPIPFDWGCHWIHGVTDNPLSAISDAVWDTVKNPGYRFREVEDEQGAVIFNGGEHDADGSARLDLFAHSLFTNLRDATVQDDAYVAANLVFSASELLWRTAPAVFDHPLFPLASWLRLAMEQSKAAPDFLAADYIRAEEEAIAANRGPKVDGGNGLVPLGLGALIQTWGQGLLAANADKLQLLLQAQVLKVQRNADEDYLLTWRQFGGEPRVSEPFDAVLVTVPTEVIRRKLLQFEPELPQELFQAFTWLPMGNFKKVALQFPPGTLSDFAHDGRRYVSTARGTGAMPVFIGVIERDDLAVLMTFDRWASHFDELPPLEAAKAAVEALRDMVGGAVRLDALVDFRVTDWRKDPFSLGAYAYTQVGPGTFAARARLINRMTGHTLLFAGEAITELAAGAAHGAWWSGTTAATKLAQTLGLNAGVDIVVQGQAPGSPPAGPGRVTLSPGGSPTRIVIHTRP